MMTTSYHGTTAYRKNGRLVSEIPEDEIVRDASDPYHPADPVYQVLDPEALLEQLAFRLVRSETDRDDYPQSRLRALVRDVLQELADEGGAIEHPAEFQPAQEFRRAG